MPEDARDIHAAIARDRDELAATIEALARKANVKARARDAVSRRATQAKGRVRGTAPGGWPEGSGLQGAPGAAPVLVAFVAGLLGGWRVTRRSSRRLGTARGHPRARMLVGAAGLAAVAGVVYRAAVVPRLARRREIGEGQKVAGEAVVIGLTADEAQPSDAR